MNNLLRRYCKLDKWFYYLMNIFYSAISRLWGSRVVSSRRCGVEGDQVAHDWVGSSEIGQIQVGFFLIATGTNRPSEVWPVGLIICSIFDHLKQNKITQKHKIWQSWFELLNESSKNCHILLNFAKVAYFGHTVIWDQFKYFSPQLATV